MEPEVDLVRLPEGECYEKLLRIADRFSQNSDASTPYSVLYC
jgi:hypothetical protein